ncbi:MFS transporter [Actinoplanes sp. NPDC048988]|uniref:MFS transporter n=1 Tax=Actinoplanes sp. NPDC048988 TaxID=3363901 RepID=UPI00371E4152
MTDVRQSRNSARDRVAYAGVIMAATVVAFAAGAGSPLFVLYQREWGFPDWELTAAFTVYAVALLATLLIAGSLSDHIGRRRVVTGALILMLVASGLFLAADGIGWVIAARVVQGLATGAATSTFTAMIVELAPDAGKRTATLISSAAPVGGLALGAFGAGVAVQVSDRPTVVVFGSLTVVFVLGIAAVLLARETATPRPHALASLRPRLAVPRRAAGEFAAAAPLLAAAWSLSGLFLGLAPSIDHGIFGVDSGTVNGLVVALQPTSSAIAGLALGGIPTRRRAVLGSALVLAGVVVAAIGAVTGTLVVFGLGAVIGGIGFGSGFAATLQILGPLAREHERGGLFSAVYLVNYLAYGVPALIAGLVVDRAGLSATVVGYAAVTAALATVALFVQTARARTASPAPIVHAPDSPRGGGRSGRVGGGNTPAPDTTSPETTSECATRPGR